MCANTHSFRAKRPDIIALGQLFETDALDTIDEDSIDLDSIKITIIAPDSLTVSFVARLKDPATAVYRVKAFKFWSNMLSTPTSNEYVGPEFLTYNKERNCARGISNPSGGYVTAQCNEVDYHDERLSQWSPVPHATFNNTRLQTFEAYPHVHISCYPQTVKIRGEELDCPIYPWSSDIMEPWQIGLHKHSPENIEISNEASSDVVVDYYKIHLKRVNHSTTDTELIKAYHNRTRELADLADKMEKLSIERDQTIEQQVAFHLGQDSAISYRQCSGILTLLIVVIGAVSAFSVIKNIKMATQLARKIKDEEKLHRRS